MWTCWNGLNPTQPVGFPLFWLVNTQLYMHLSITGFHRGPLLDPSFLHRCYIYFYENYIQIHPALIANAPGSHDSLTAWNSGCQKLSQFKWKQNSIFGSWSLHKNRMPKFQNALAETIWHLSGKCNCYLKPSWEGNQVCQLSLCQGKKTQKGRGPSKKQPRCIKDTQKPQQERLTTHLNLIY